MDSPPSLDRARVALFLDVDGTPIEIDKHPDHVHVAQSPRRLLEHLEVACDALMGEAPFRDRQADQADFGTAGGPGGITARSGDGGRPTAARFGLAYVGVAQCWLGGRLGGGGGCAAA